MLSPLELRGSVVMATGLFCTEVPIKYKKTASSRGLSSVMVGSRGIEPPTSTVSRWRSPTELTAPILCKKLLKWCRGPESNRYGGHPPQDFKSCASAYSATPASCRHPLFPEEKGYWWAHQDSNLGPIGYEPTALPTEL